MAKTVSPPSWLIGYDRILRKVLVVPEFFLPVTVGCVAVSILVGIVCRSYLDMSLAWVEELCRYLMVWMTFLGLPVVVYKKDLVAVLLLHSKVGESVSRVLALVIHLTVLATTAVLLYYSVIYTKSGIGMRMVSMDFIPMFYVYVSMPLSFVLVFMVELKNTLETVLGIEKLDVMMQAGLEAE